MQSGFAVYLKGIPFGATPSGIRKCVEEALQEFPVFPHEPKIHLDEAIVWLPSRDYQKKLCLNTVKIRIAGTKISAKKANAETVKAFLQKCKPARKSNPNPGSNIIKFQKQRKKQERKKNKAKLQQQNDNKAKKNKNNASGRGRGRGRGVGRGRGRGRGAPGLARVQPIIQPITRPIVHVDHQNDDFKDKDDDVIRNAEYDDNDKDIVPKVINNDGCSLYDFIPYFNISPDDDDDDDNDGGAKSRCIVWYQYLIYVTKASQPFYVTYPADWCWDIEGQWIKLQQAYVLNPSQAEQVASKFSIGGTGGGCETHHNMVVDLINMKLTDNNTDNTFEFRRTSSLIGKLIKHGFIEFNRYHKKGKELFIYDRKTGYKDNISEIKSSINVNDYVVFNAWWNLDDNNKYVYDISSKINVNNIGIPGLGPCEIQYRLIAINVRLATPEDIEELLGTNKKDNLNVINYDHDHTIGSRDVQLNALNPLSPSLLPHDIESSAATNSLNYADPIIADDFGKQIYSGLLISLRKDRTGLIVCFPFKQRLKKSLTLIFHTRYMKNKSDINKLKCNMNLEFNIGVNPINYGQGLYGYVAYNIVISLHGFSNPYIPKTIARINRRHRGKIVIKPEHNQYGFIYNEIHNNMCHIDLNVIKHSSNNNKFDENEYREGVYVRYNEKKVNISDKDGNDNIHASGGRDTEFKYIAHDIISIKKYLNISQYYTSDNYVKYKSKRYIINKKLRIDEDRNIEFKKILVNFDDDYSDLYLIIEQAEVNVNAFLNTSGGAIFFGIADDGTIIGQELMTKNKRDYIRNNIGQRLNHFKPPVPPEYYNVEFKEVIDKYGYVLDNTFIIIIHVAKLYSGKNIKQHVKFSTSQGQIYERRITSIGTSKKIKQLMAVNSRPTSLLNKNVSFGLKPKFITLDGVDNAKSKRKPNNIDDSDFGSSSDDDDDIQDHKSNNSDDQPYDYSKDDVIQAQQAMMNNKLPILNNNRHTIPILPTTSYKSKPAWATGVPHPIQHPPHQAHPSIVIEPDPGPDPVAAEFGVPKFTTPHLNTLPIPPNDNEGVIKLTKRVQLKLNEMMVISDYILLPQWSVVLTMQASPVYNAQKTTWILLNKIENQIIKQKTQEIALKKQKQQQRNLRLNQYNTRSMFNNATFITGASNIAQQQLQSNIIQPSSISNNNIISSGISHLSAIPNINEPPPQQQPQPQPVPMTAAMIVRNNQFNKPDPQNQFNKPDDIQSKSIKDKHGLPILPDKSKYKAVAMEYCQKMGWKRPTESAQNVGPGYRATVTFGIPGREKSASGEGTKQKTAIYEAYIKLVPVVIPKTAAIALMVKWLPGYVKTKKIDIATRNDTYGQSVMKHPKSVLLEWAQKNSIAPPKTVFSEFNDISRNIRIWSAKVTFCGKTIEAKGTKKKESESKCFTKLLKHVMSGGIKSQKQ